MAKALGLGLNKWVGPDRLGLRLVRLEYNELDLRELDLMS